jgi:glycosyltransferase involved in cell wall biosynthesis
MVTPRVSVVIPVRNGRPYIEQSVGTAIEAARVIGDAEVIVRENGSTDGTREWLEQNTALGYRLIVGEGTTARDNWNLVVAEASGAYVKLLCADDYLTEGGLARQLDAAEAAPEVVLVASRRTIVDERGETVMGTRGLSGMVGTMPGRTAATRAAMSGTNPFGEPSSVLFRRDALTAAGSFSDEHPYVIDLDMYVRVLQQGAFLGLSTTDAAFRINPTSWSRALGRRQYSDFRGWTRKAVREGLVSPSLVSRGLSAPRSAGMYLARQAVMSLARARRR